MSPFSKKYATFKLWKLAQGGISTPYITRIGKSHALNPSATLTQLRGHGVGVPNILYGGIELSPKQILTKNKIRNVVVVMRRSDITFTQACREYQITPNTFKKYGRGLIVKKGGVFHAKKIDKIFVTGMQFWNKGKGLLSISPRDSVERAKIGQYMNAVGRFINRNDAQPLGEMAKDKGMRGVYDVNGKFHKFEYNLDKLWEMHTKEGKVWGEDLDIYVEGVGAYA